ncbi:ribosome biogenesis GTPase Der [Coprothermobacteraceae bacterium]|nr:ribosome biogenesis GTPase Der [Coprothermobacteraceae bacterium]
MKRFVIIGAPNVGKSSLFNRLTGSRKALVYDMPGVTRDYLVETTEWNGKVFEVVDTGGLYRGEQDLESYWERALGVAEDADVVLFVVDASQPMTAVEYEIADKLRRMGKNTIVVGNKSDLLEEWLNPELYGFGFSEVILVSAATGRGVGDLLDLMANKVEAEDEGFPEQPEFRVTIIGRANAGKSTLINALLGYQRVVVSEVPGTTLDFISETVFLRGLAVELTDTPGLRKGDLRRLSVPEMLAVKRLKNRVTRQQVLLHVVDASQGFSSLDEGVIRMAEEEGIGYVVVFNKMDLARDPLKMGKDLRDAFVARFPWVDKKAVVPASALEGFNLDRILDALSLAYEDYKCKFKTSEVVDVVKDIQEYIPGYKFYYGVHVSTLPSVFRVFTNRPTMQATLMTYFRRQLKQRLSIKTALPKIILEKH